MEKGIKELPKNFTKKAIFLRVSWLVQFLSPPTPLFPPTGHFFVLQNLWLVTNAAHHSVACVAGIKRGRGNLGAREHVGLSRAQIPPSPINAGHAG